MLALSETNIERRHATLCKQQERKCNRPNLNVDTRFVIAHTDFESQYKGILSIRRGDIIRVQAGGNTHPKWWLGTVVKSYYGSKGYGYFFPVLTESYDFMDTRIAPRIPMVLLDPNGKLRNGGKKRR
ncbi:hypothetical protein COEREDRAFT_88350 [Coemansia reversa NRRL 1564]|uniref:SH3 domain-containing protein n=1 Tax=Coemansia reversa (strain ATCC 12441 / NRRL 1564) TaxID=763665 RepID=A0A2G5B743_COERN|nr:hypothetical protein COEREDRAFT_88350 [Coemansia reversa NRRL 1564]|eukprot:PIA14820.1 hypothetical protein COEREDRAFT_88350 [Coemansia reversa NRRL 1564]